MPTWQVFLFFIGFSAAVVLFMGPALWSSHTEMLFTRLWRLLRGKPRRGAQPHVAEGNAEASEGDEWRPSASADGPPPRT